MERIFERIRTIFGLSESAKKWMPVIVGVFALGFLMRLATLGIFLTYDPGFIYDNDSDGYITLAQNLEQGNGFSVEKEFPYAPDSFRTPGYPMFLAAHHMVFGSFIPALFTQILLSVLIAYLMLLIADRYMKIEIGIIAAAVFFCMPFSLLVTERYLTQVVFTAVIMLITWFWLEYLSKNYAKYLLLTALLLPIAALIRPIAIAIVAPLIASLALKWIWKTASWKQVLGASFCIVLVFAAGLAPWLWRNYQVFETASLSSLPPFQLYFYDDPAIYATAHKLSYDEAKKELDARIAKITGFTHDQAPDLYGEFSEFTPTLMKEGLRVAFENPTALVETRIIQFGKFFVRDGIRYWIERYGIDTAHGYGFLLVALERIILAIFAVGFFFAGIRSLIQKNPALTFMALMVLYFAVLTGVMASSGLRYPAEALFLLLGTIGLFEIYAIIRTRLPKKP